MDFEETDKVTFFRKINYTFHVCAGITFNILRTLVSVSDIGPWPNIIEISVILHRLHSSIRLIHHMYLRSPSDIPIQGTAKILLLVQLDDLFKFVYFAVVDNRAVSLLATTAIPDRFSEGFPRWNSTSSLSDLAQPICFRNTLLQQIIRYVVNWLRRWGQFRWQIKQQQLNDTISSRKECCKSAEYRGACIGHDKEHHTYLHVTISQIDAKRNDAADISDCECFPAGKD